MLIRFLKTLHLLPVYPIDLLIEAKRSFLWTSGLCSAIDLSAAFFNLHGAETYTHYIEKYDRNIAIQNFNGEYHPYWWEVGIWNTGRLDFLNFLIKENKTNKIDLRNIKVPISDKKSTNIKISERDGLFLSRNKKMK